MCAFRWDRGSTRGAHGCREVCFLKHGCDTGGKKGGGVRCSDGEAAAAPRERSPERELQVQPAGPWASDEKTTSVEFNFFPPLTSDTCYVHGFSASPRFYEIIFWINAFLTLSPIRLWLKPQPTIPPPRLSRSVADAPVRRLFLGLFSPLFVSSKPCF